MVEKFRAHQLGGFREKIDEKEREIVGFRKKVQESTSLVLKGLVGVKRVVHEKVPAGVNQLGLTLTGFLYLQALFIEKGRIEMTWAVLRKFGYDDDLKLRRFSSSSI
uniref:EF hand associated type-2 domain-containing protein n=1 Tax=Quercus lobata TaxID=97700 RepID=A0A7N2KR94_QUELO